MKRNIGFTTVRVTVIALIGMICSTRLDAEFQEPKLLLSASAGSGPGEFGWWFPSQSEEGEPIFPSDFAVDREGNFWVLDDVNNRIQKFKGSGQFISSWDGGGKTIQRGASLDADGEGNLYVITRLQKQLKITKLNSEAQEIANISFEYQQSASFNLRVTSKGEMSIFGGSKALFLDKEGQVSAIKTGVHTIFSSPYGNHLLTASSEDGGRWTFKKHLGVPKEGTTETLVSVRKQGSQRGRTVLIDRNGHLFVYSIEKEGPGSIQVYDHQGEYLSTIPDCPKNMKGRPGSGDDFTTDIHGNFYQLQIIPEWERESAEGFVKIWKWERGE